MAFSNLLMTACTYLRVPKLYFIINVLLCDIICVLVTLCTMATTSTPSTLETSIVPMDLTLPSRPGTYSPIVLDQIIVKYDNYIICMYV